MLRGAPLMAFIPVTSFESATWFYVDTLGLELTEMSGFSLVLDAGGTMLRLAKVEVFTPHPFTIAGWRVPDVSRAVDSLSDRGIACLRFDGMEQDDAGVWATPGGDRVAWFKDLDGNTLSVAQFADGAT